MNMAAIHNKLQVLRALVARLQGELDLSNFSGVVKEVSDNLVRIELTEKESDGKPRLSPWLRYVVVSNKS